MNVSFHKVYGFDTDKKLDAGYGTSVYGCGAILEIKDKLSIVGTQH